MVTPQQLSAGLGRLIQTAIALIVLAAFGSFADQLPGMYISIAGVFRVLDAIRLGVAVAMVALVVGAVRPVGDVITYYAGLAFGIYRDPQRARLSGDARRLADGASYVVAIALSWVVVNQQIPTILRTLGGRALDWLPTVVTLGFLAGLLYVLFRMYQSVQPILSEVSMGIGGKIAGATEVRCPRCAAPNSVNVRFCANCGLDLIALRQQAAPPPGGVPCRVCGTPNALGARFCGGCGAGLSDPAAVGAPYGNGGPAVVPMGAAPRAPAAGGPWTATGVAVGPAAAPGIGPTASVRPVAAPRCGACGGPLTSEDVFCPACGVPAKKA